MTYPSNNEIIFVHSSSGRQFWSLREPPLWQVPVVLSALSHLAQLLK